MGKLQPIQMPLPAVNPISVHSHRLAAWAASRAIKILECCGFNSEFSSPNQLPLANFVGNWHRNCQTEVIKQADFQQLTFSHGEAAKLLNIYLKVRFV